MNNETKNCQSCKKDFVVEVEDFNYYKKINVPPPTFCPECRLIRRFMWRNERYLYKNTCGLCKKSELSCFSPDSPYTIYCPECWWSDKWDPTSYAKEYDFSKSFFEQFSEHLKSVPLLSRWVIAGTLIRSEYNNLVGHLKDCYMVFHADNNESCGYASGLKYSKDSFDVTLLQHSELCYESVNVIRGYQNYYSVDCEDSRNVWFSHSLVSCNDCFGCVGLRKKQYHIFNKPYSKEEYQKKMEEFNLSSYKSVREHMAKAHEFWVQHPVKFIRGRHNVNSSGDYIYDSKNTKLSYEMFGAEDCKYCQFNSVPPTKDCYDYTEWSLGSELIYEGLLCGEGVAKLKFCAHASQEVSDAEYSYNSFGSSNLFGCVSSRKMQYSIFNKEYPKDEFKELTAKIREHMDEVPYTDSKGRVYTYGEFFPAEIAPFTYNEGTAQEFFPITEGKAREQGFRWKEMDEKPYEPTTSWADLPDTIEEVKDDILEQIILCKAWGEDTEEAKRHNCTKAFRLIPAELQFYRQNKIPLPRKCHNSRHFDRIKHRAPIKFWHRQCMCDYEIYKNDSKHSHHETGRCPNKFETSYDPDRKEIIYCEQCYQAEVI